MLPTFDENLKTITQKITKIGEGLVKSNELLLSALSDCNKETFEEAKSYIKNISAKTNEIDNEIIKVLALYAPEARDLRQVVAYLKITNELSRACSNTRSFIKGFTDVCTFIDVETVNEYALPMQTSTVKAVQIAVSMINISDVDEIQELYNEALIEESKADDLYEMVERKLSAQAAESNEFEKYYKMLRALRKSSKIASRANAMANLLVYIKIGGNFQN